MLQLLGPVTLRGVEALVQGIGFWYRLQQFCLHQLHSTKKAAGELRDERLRKRSGRRERRPHAARRTPRYRAVVTAHTSDGRERTAAADKRHLPAQTFCFYILDLVHALLTSARTSALLALVRYEAADE